MVAEDGSRNKKTQTNLTTVTMSTSGAESAHVENFNPDDCGCQTIEIENLRKEKTITKGLMTNAQRALLVGLTEEQKNPEEVRKGLDVLEDASKCTMEILLRIEELFSKENDMKNQTKNNQRNGDDLILTNMTRQSIVRRLNCQQ